MFSHCANPKCGIAFRFLHSGRVFRFDIPLEHPVQAGQDILWDADGKPRRTELFWLCEECASSLTLVLGADGRIAIEELKEVAAD